jgi:MoxR-like ATPase
MSDHKKIRVQEKELQKRLEKLEKKHSAHALYNDHKQDAERKIKSKNHTHSKSRIIVHKKNKNKVNHKKHFVHSKKEHSPKKVYAAVLNSDDLSKYSKDQKIDRASIESIKKSAVYIKKLKNEISRVIIGQDKVVDGLIRGLICNGHVLLEGVPGIAKTLTIRALGQATGCSVKRVQFTVDLLPTDITGITSYTPGKGFETIKGPIFANFLIADEINRSPPKTQSALIEAMQEKQVTIGKESFSLPNPFFVMATRNPLENTGVYPLPEAQVDRFLFNVIMGYPTESEEKKIMEENATLKKFEDFKLKSVINPKDIITMQDLVRKIYLSDHIKSYIISIVGMTRNKKFKYSDCVAYGASPRASIALFIASKARALMEGRSYVLPEDVKAVCFDVLRHRVILSYQATIKGLNSEDIIKGILEEVRV